jgi:hypothetical protein
LVNAFEQPAAGNRAGRDHRGRGVSRFREEDPVYLEASEVGESGGVLACEKVGVDHTSREVVGRPKVCGCPRGREEQWCLESTADGEGVRSGAHVLCNMGRLRDSVERGQWVAHELVSGVGKVRRSRMLRAVPHEHLPVSGEGGLEVEDMLTEHETQLGEDTKGFEESFRFGFRVECVCWRHTTRPDGTWVWWRLAADRNVRTLGGARCGAPPPRGLFVSESCFCPILVLRRVHVWNSKWVA